MTKTQTSDLWNNILKNIQSNAGNAGTFLDQIKGNQKFQELARKLQVEPFVAALDAVNVQTAQQHVKQLKAKYPDHSPGEIVNRLIQEKAVLMGVKGMASSILPGFAAGFLAVDITTSMVMQAELIYQIAHVYDMDLKDSARKAEALTIFSLVLGGGAALGIGLAGVARNIPMAGVVVGASSNAVMTYAVGLSANQYYSAIYKGKNQQEAFDESQKATEKPLQSASNQEIALDGILAHVILAGHPELSPSDVKKNLENLPVEPQMRSRIAAHVESLKDFDTLLSDLQPEYGLVALAQSERLARTDAQINAQEKNLLDKLEQHFRAQKEVLESMHQSNYILTEDFKATIRGITFSKDGMYLCACSDDKSLRIWKTYDDGLSFQQVYHLDAHTDQVKALCLSQSGDCLVTASKDGTIALWDYRNGKTIHKFDSGHRKGIYALAFGAEELLASGSEDGEIKLWNAGSGALKRSILEHRAPVWCLAFDPSGTTLASGSNDNTVRLWGSSGKHLRTLEGHRNGIYALAFSPDAKTLATGCWDRSIGLWNVETGDRYATLEGHDAAVWQLIFTPDGRHLISSADDNSIRVWDLETQTLRIRFDGHRNGVYALALSPQNSIIASGSWDRSLRLWTIDLDE